MPTQSSHTTSFWSALFAALGAWQGMSLLGPTPSPPR